ncbi:MAG: AraC family transcriptional regulator ligand-binding domain-containing protein [Sinimarinibacterium sp.]|jgi:AraC-like DNA-binding protein
MRDRDVLVPARYYARLAGALAREGIDFARVLRSLRLPDGALDQPEATLKFSQVDRLITRVTQLSRRSDLAFDIGQQLTATSHSFVGFGMLNSVNLDQALRFEAQYFTLVMPSFRMRYTSGPDYGELHFAPTVAMSHTCLTFHLEAIGTAALREVADLTGGRLPPCRLDLSIDEPPHVQRYAELRDVRCRFAAESTPGVRLRLLDDPRSYPLAMADAHARQLAEARCRALVQRVASVRQFADWVAMTLREVGDALPSLAELAAHLNMSPRTLNRYLEREGTSYRALAGEVQHELACNRLAAGVLSVSEVGYSLGFTDSSNFARAFRVRENCSPGEYQRAAASTGPTRTPPSPARPRPRRT